MQNLYELKKQAGLPLNETHSPVVITLKDETAQNRYADFVDSGLYGDADEFVPIEQFKPQSTELFAVVKNTGNYRNTDDLYGIRDGKLFFVDTVDSNEVHILGMTPELFIQTVKKIESGES